jgi:putative transposase
LAVAVGFAVGLRCGCPILALFEGGAFGHLFGPDFFFLSMPRGLKRYYGKHDLHFITCSCYRRLPLLGSFRARNLFVKILGELRDTYGFALVGYVVMPEHVHLLISEPRKGTPSTVMQLLKQRVSREMRKRRRKQVAGQFKFQFGREDSLPQFWQRRFYDFNVWSHKKKIEKLSYMHFNPVKRGLVDSPRDWVWSSYRFYEGQDNGMVSIDAAGQRMEAKISTSEVAGPQRTAHG